MGNYVFTTDVLLDALRRDALNPASKHDMGGDIIPMLVDKGDGPGLRLQATTTCPGSTDRDRGYWRDVGTLDSFYEAHMDLISVHPIFNLYNYDWPIYTSHDPMPPAKFVHNEERPERPGGRLDGLPRRRRLRLAASSDSVVSPNVRSTRGPSVTRLRAHGQRAVGRHAVVRNAILDKNVVVPEGARSASTSTRTASAASPSPTAGSWSSARASGHRLTGEADRRVDAAGSLRRADQQPARDR